MASAGGWRIAAALLLGLGFPAAARAQVCPRVPAGLRCAPLPKDGWMRREALQALDAEGRRRVARGDYPGAAQAFGCLVEGDPTPESAGNLAVVLREQDDLGDALLVARCAEELAPPGPTRARARTRREEIERRLGLPATPAATVAASEAPVDLATVAVPPVPSGTNVAAPALTLPVPPATPVRSYRRPGYLALGMGLAALVGGGIVYAIARDRARQFEDEQQRSGYTEQARTLRTDAQRLETASWISAASGLAAAAVGGVLLTF